MIITNEQFKEIIIAGAGFVIDSPTMSLRDIKQIAEQAGKSRVRITLKNVSALTADHLKQIAALAPGYITIDLT
jgi:hypothetical protein